MASVTIFFSPFGPVMTPLALVVGMLNEKAVGPPMYGRAEAAEQRPQHGVGVGDRAERRARVRTKAFLVDEDGGGQPLEDTSTSGRGRFGMNPWTKVE